MWKGNLAILRHKERPAALRVFVADGLIPGRAAKQQRYIGEFEIDANEPWVPDQAEDDEGLMRSVIVFRLRPVGPALVRAQDFSRSGDAAHQTEANLVDLEADETAEYTVPGGEARVATRREYLLSEEFRTSLGARGETLRRWRLRPPGSLRSLYTDLYDAERGELYEVKATNSREDIRMAIGQLLDYRRWIEPSPVRITVVIPGPPLPDMADLLAALGIGVVYKEREHGPFVRQGPNEDGQ
jgi:hypothetical protein